jgi:hypothetical protein
MAVLAVPGAPGLVSLRQDRRRPDRRRRLSRNPLILWPALIAVAICLRDWIVTRRVDAFLVLAFYFGPYLAWALLPRTLGFIYYYLPAATTASLALVYALKRGSMPAGCCGPCCSRFCRLCRNVADIGRVHRNFDGDIQPPDDLPELDLRWPSHRSPHEQSNDGSTCPGCGLAVDSSQYESLESPF